MEGPLRALHSHVTVLDVGGVGDKYTGLDKTMSLVVVEPYRLKVRGRETLRSCTVWV